MTSQLSLAPRCFTSSSAPSRVEMSSSGGDNNTSGDGAVVISSDEGDSRHSLDEHPRSKSPQDRSIEYIGTIKKEIRRILPHISYLTLLR